MTDTTPQPSRSDARVSVLVISHNAARFIAQALESALGQTHAPHEVVVVDDSTDDSPRIVGRYVTRAPAVVKLHRLAPCSITTARNTALGLVSGDHVAFLDADDVWLPRKTQRQLEAIADRPDAVGAFSPYFDFQIDLDDRGRFVPKPGKDEPTAGDVLLDQNLASSMVLIRRDAIGGLRFEENICEDTIFMAELGLRGRWVRVAEPLIAKRVHDAQASRGDWHYVRNTQVRKAWAESRRDQLGGAQTQRVLGELDRQLIQFLEGRYWRRDLADLKAMCRETARVCPEAFAQSFLARTRIYPRWVYRLRDLVGGEKSA